MPRRSILSAAESGSLLRTAEIPGPTCHCNTHNNQPSSLVKAYRLKDGRVRLTLSKTLVLVRLDRGQQALPVHGSG